MVSELILICRCPKCNGTGYVTNPAWQADMASWSEDALQQFIDDNGPEEFYCTECDGTGEILTEAGLAIIRLVRKHM